MSVYRETAFNRIYNKVVFFEINLFNNRAVFCRKNCILFHWGYSDKSWVANIIDPLVLKINDSINKHCIISMYMKIVQF